MFQTSPQIGSIMHPTAHLNASRDTSAQDVPVSSMLPKGLSENSNEVCSNAQDANMSISNSSGATTPTSVRSSMSYESHASSTSTSASSRPRRSSMKPSLKSTQDVVVNFSRKSSPPTVRFADPEPLSRPKPAPVQQPRRSQSQRNGVPNPLLRHHQRPPLSVSTSPLSRYSAGPQAYSTLPPRGVPILQSDQIRYPKPRASQRFSAPVLPSRPDPRWSGIPLPANFTPPSLALEHRVTSFQSIASNLSTQSAPATLQSLPSSSPQGQYNPLSHYIPCLHPGCKTHYSRTHSGPTYHLPQGPYSLSKRHGYCAPHATKELKDATARCKRQWEVLRQNAGRKTLGQIATEFDEYMEDFRSERRGEDAELLRHQKSVVLGTPAVKLNQPITATNDTQWRWLYTPRHCTRVSCHSKPYSPFANHLFAFYHSSRPSTFSPLTTLCPACATTEVESFELLVMQKWGSRCGWDDEEWNKWFEGAVREREREKGFWEGAQEREVRERRVRRTEKGEGVKVKEANEKGSESGDMVKLEDGLKKKKKSVFRRMFGAAKGVE